MNKSLPRKGKLAIIISASAIVVAAVVILLVAFLSGPDSYRLLKIFDIKGSASVDRGKAGTLEAYSGMNLENGDTVSVGGESSMHLNLDDDKYVLLEENTVLELVAKGSASNSETVLKLISGAILNEITQPLSSGSTYCVNTPKATMAVRGTSFRVAVIKQADGSYITVLQTFHGSVEVQLYDEEGNPNGEPVYIGEGKSVAILTKPNSENDADIDGTSMFIIYDSETGEYTLVREGEDPVVNINFYDIPDDILDEVIKTNDNGDIIINGNVIGNIKTVLGDDETGEAPSGDEDTDETTVSSDDEIPTIPSEENVTTDNPDGEPNADPTDNSNGENNAPASSSVSNTPNSETTVPSDKGKGFVIIGEPASEGDGSGKAKEESKTEDTEKTDTALGTVSSISTVSESETVSSSSVTTETESAVIHTITFRMSNESIVTKKVTHGKTAASVMPAHTVTDGMTYKWLTSNETEYDTSTVVTEDFTLYEVGTVVQRTITFNKYDGSVVTKTVDYGDTAASVMPAHSTTAGMIFKWLTSEETEYDTSTVVTEDFTLTEAGTLIQCTITFNKFDESVVTRNVSYGDTAASVMPAHSAFAGMTFKWVTSDEAGDEVEYDISSAVTEDLTLIETGALNQYTVTFNGYNNSVIDTQAVYHGRGATEPDMSELNRVSGTDGKTYIFLQWDTEFTEITSDLTVNAVYLSADNFAEFLTVYSGNIISGEALNISSGSASAVLPVAPSNANTPSGMSFGWFNANSGFTNGSGLVENGTSDPSAAYCEYVYNSPVYAPGSSVEISSNTRFAGKNYCKVEFYVGASCISTQYLFEGSTYGDAYAPTVSDDELEQLTGLANVGQDGWYVDDHTYTWESLSETTVTKDYRVDLVVYAVL